MSHLDTTRQVIDRCVYLNERYDPNFPTLDNGNRPSPEDELRHGRQYRAVLARPTAWAHWISTGQGPHPVVWDLGIETDHGILWVPDAMLDPHYAVPTD